MAVNIISSMAVIGAGLAFYEQKREGLIIALQSALREFEMQLLSVPGLS